MRFYLTEVARLLNEQLRIYTREEKHLPWFYKVLSIITIQNSASCQEALDLMLKNKIHHLVVMDGQTLLGTVTDRDIFYRWFKQREGNHIPLSKLSLASAVRTDCPIASPDTSLFQIADWMRSLKISVLLYRASDGSLNALTDTDLLEILWSMVRKDSLFEKFLTATETGLSSPTAQKIIEMLSQMGL